MIPKCYARVNCFATYYYDISAEHYFNTKECLNKLIELKYESEEAINIEGKMDKSIMISIVFSSMCIESYLNNYAATCIGDSFFYENFDKLSVINKFSMISKFILNVEFDKSKSYYSLIKSLIKNRNELVHNKSKELNLQNFDNAHITKTDVSYYAELELNIKKYRKWFIKAANGIKAIKEMCLFFDKYDKNANAISLIFNPIFCNLTYDKEHYKRIVLEDFKLDYEPEL